MTRISKETPENIIQAFYLIFDMLCLADSNLYKYKSLIDKCVNYTYKNNSFIKCSGSSSPKAHHYGTGELVFHTSEVLGLCLGTVSQDNLTLLQHPDVNLGDLFFAALYHDLGKVHDYETYWDQKYATPRLEWQSTEEKYKFHHISRSALLWDKFATEAGYPEYNKNEVIHAILAHHQLKDWGSPVQPRTAIAWILHTADNLSAQLNRLKNNPAT